MRLPLMTMRRWMIAVADSIVLLPLMAGVIWWLSPEQVRIRSLINAYSAKAAQHAAQNEKFASLAKYSDMGHAIAIRNGELVHIPIAQRPELVTKYLALAKYHGALKRRYEDAAWHPRFPVEPDPPPPEP